MTFNVDTTVQLFCHEQYLKNLNGRHPTGRSLFFIVNHRAVFMLFLITTRAQWDLKLSGKWMLFEVQKVIVHTSLT